MVRFPDAEMISGAMRRGPLCGGAGRGIGRGVGRVGTDPDEPARGFVVALTFGRFAGRLGAVGGAPVGRGCPFDPVIVGLTCGRFAGRLEASMAPAGFCGGAPWPPFDGADGEEAGAVLCFVAVPDFVVAAFAGALTGAFAGALTGAFAGAFTDAFASGFAAGVGALFGFTTGFESR
jgi:hypothetical protein